MIKRDYFPIGNKGFVSFENVPTLIRNNNHIFINDITYSFTSMDDAIEAMDTLWQMYDEEQQFRNQKKAI